MTIFSLNFMSGAETDRFTKNAGCLGLVPPFLRFLFTRDVSTKEQPDNFLEFLIGETDRLNWPNQWWLEMHETPASIIGDMYSLYTGAQWGSRPLTERVRKAFTIWSQAEGKEKVAPRRHELFTAFATASPLVTDIGEADPETIDREVDMNNLFSAAFSPRELVDGLREYEDAVTEPNDTNLTAARRITHALANQIRYENIGLDEATRKKSIGVLLPFTALPSPNIKEDIGDIVYSTRPPSMDEEIPLDFALCGLYSMADAFNETAFRAREQIKRLIENGDKGVCAVLIDKLFATPTDHANRQFWSNLADKVIGDIRAVEYFIPLATMLLEEDIDTSVFASICKGLDGILSISNIKGINVKEIMVDSLARVVLDVVLRVYCDTPLNPDSSTKRVHMLELATSIKAIYPELFTKTSVQELVSEVAAQPHATWTPGKTRMTERRAIICLTS